jgi:hypothetical protein
MNAQESSAKRYRVIWSVEDREFVGLCADFPSLSWLASTRAAARKGIRRLVAEVLADLAAEQSKLLSSTKLSARSH